jgi:hypothetical protein
MNAESITKLYEAGIAEGYARAIADVQAACASLWPQGQYDRFNEHMLAVRLRKLAEEAAEAPGWTLHNGGIRKDDDDPYGLIALAEATKPEGKES